MRTALVVTALIATAIITGCNKKRMAYLGHWDGGFDVTSSTAAVKSSDLVMRGYLQLYRTGDKFLMQLSNPTQVLNLSGTWQMIGDHRIELTFHGFRLDEPDLVKLKGMRRPFMDPEALRTAYTKPLILDITSDGMRLEGLLVRIGPLLGKHGFHKGG